ncbi:hypothetical protein [Alicyclobacillus sp. SO9]|uniref:hypothetical protein n=1 Tax=Alicyclobacillus sp. SO9 TaxID=2665646 RepID=UPI0018E79A35|nr:hypothetical protein [Alicyclobacillus sp. SO9]QQE77441.1 hypothetical protein GI364_15995 [Alicyclobacillus sp. SO9]
MRVIYIRKPKVFRASPSIQLLEFERSWSGGGTKHVGYHWVSLRPFRWFYSFAAHPSSADSIAMSASAASKQLMGG